MSDTKDTLKNAGHKAAETAKNVGHAVAETAKNVGHKVAEGAEQAKEWVKEKTGMGDKTGCGTAKAASDVKERMDVIASCGTKVGVVDHVESGTIKLTKNDSPDGQHHFIPMGWVDHVDNHVHLKKNSQDAKQEWKSDAAGCASCGA